jgi:hypothetical protein
MTKNTINIKRELHKKFLKDYFIIEAFSNDDHSEYLIDKIIEGTKKKNNRNFENIFKNCFSFFKLSRTSG